MDVSTASIYSASSGLGDGIVILTVVMVIAAWCVPVIIAQLFGLPRKGAIAVLTLALGWTGVAWLAGLIIVTVGAILASRDQLSPAPAPAGPQHREPATAPRPARPAGSDPYGSGMLPAGQPRRTPVSHRAPVGRPQ